MLKVLKFKWKELKGEEIIAIPAVGEHNNFVTEEYAPSVGFYDSDTLEFTSFEDRYIKMLNKGEVLFHKNHLIFKEGFQEEYYQYATKFIDDIEDKELYLNLKNKSDYTFVSNMVKAAKIGITTKERAINTLAKYFTNENFLDSYL